MPVPRLPIATLKTSFAVVVPLLLSAFVFLSTLILLQIIPVTLATAPLWLKPFAWFATLMANMTFHTSLPAVAAVVNVMALSWLYQSVALIGFSILAAFISVVPLVVLNTVWEALAMGVSKLQQIFDDQNQLKIILKNDETNNDETNSVKKTLKDPESDETHENQDFSTEGDLVRTGSYGDSELLDRFLLRRYSNNSSSEGSSSTESLPTLWWQDNLGDCLAYDALEQAFEWQLKIEVPEELFDEILQLETNKTFLRGPLSFVRQSDSKQAAKVKSIIFPWVQQFIKEHRLSWLAEHSHPIRFWHYLTAMQQDQLQQLWLERELSTLLTQLGVWKHLTVAQVKTKVSSELTQVTEDKNEEKAKQLIAAIFEPEDFIEREKPRIQAKLYYSQQASSTAEMDSQIVTWLQQTVDAFGLVFLMRLENLDDKFYEKYLPQLKNKDTKVVINPIKVLEELFHKNQQEGKDADLVEFYAVTARFRLNLLNVILKINPLLCYVVENPQIKESLKNKFKGDYSSNHSLNARVKMEDYAYSTIEKAYDALPKHCKAQYQAVLKQNSKHDEIQPKANDHALTSEKQAEANAHMTSP